MTQRYQVVPLPDSPSALDQRRLAPTLVLVQASRPMSFGFSVHYVLARSGSRRLRGITSRG
jgi:hypothetical protein